MELAYNLGMDKQIAEHHRIVAERLAVAKSQTDLEKLAHYHRTRVQEFQHERLVHLLGTFFFVGLFLAALAIFLATAAMDIVMNCLLGTLTLILFVLDIAYIRHYYQLENGIQRLYGFTVKIEEKCLKDEK